MRFRGWIWEPGRPRMKAPSEPSSEIEDRSIPLSLSLGDKISKSLKVGFLQDYPKE